MTKPLVALISGHEEDERVCLARKAFFDGVLAVTSDVVFHQTFEGFNALLPNAGIAVIWGVSSNKFGARTAYRDVVRDKYKHVICIERGFVDREHYYSAGWDSVGGEADFCNANAPDDRFKKLNVSLSPWRVFGDYYLLVGQIPHDTSVQEIGDYDRWLYRTAETLLESNRVIFRNHPLRHDMPTLPSGVEISTDYLFQDIKDAHTVVGYSSNTLVEAGFAGKPTVSYGSKAMNYKGFGGRGAWAARLAYAQWTLDEFRSGEAFTHLLKGRFGNETLRR